MFAPFSVVALACLVDVAFPPSMIAGARLFVVFLSSSLFKRNMHACSTVIFLVLCGIALQSCEACVVTCNTEDEYRALRKNNTFAGVVTLYHASWSTSSKAYIPVFAEACAEYASYAPPADGESTAFVFASVDSKELPRLAREAVVRKFPTVVLYVTDDENPVLYTPLEGTPSELAKYVAESLTTARRRMFLRKKEVAEHKFRNMPHPSPGSVIELTPESFDMYVMHPHKLAFVMFYAPWCRHCTSSKPELRLVAEYFSKDETVVIGQIDADENNEIREKYKIESYPTFFLFGKGRLAKHGLRYEGHRHHIDMQMWIDTQNQVLRHEDELLRRHPDLKIPETEADLHHFAQQEKDQ